LIEVKKNIDILSSPGHRGCKEQN